MYQRKYPIKTVRELPPNYTGVAFSQKPPQTFRAAEVNEPKQEEKLNKLAPAGAERESPYDADTGSTPRFPLFSKEADASVSTPLSQDGSKRITAKDTHASAEAEDSLLIGSIVKELAGRLDSDTLFFVMILLAVLKER